MLEFLLVILLGIVIGAVAVGFSPPLARFAAKIRARLALSSAELTADDEAIHWAIDLLDAQPVIQVNSASQYWLDRLKALVGRTP